MNDKLEQMIKEMEELQSNKTSAAGSMEWRKSFRKLNSQITDEMMTITDKESFMSVKVRMDSILYGV